MGKIRNINLEKNLNFVRIYFLSRNQKIKDRIMLKRMQVVKGK